MKLNLCYIATRQMFHNSLRTEGGADRAAVAKLVAEGGRIGL